MNFLVFIDPGKKIRGWYLYVFFVPIQVIYAEKAYLNRSFQLAHEIVGSLQRFSAHSQDFRFPPGIFAFPHHLSTNSHSLISLHKNSSEIFFFNNDALFRGTTFALQKSS